jgi:hypothetical protein
MGLFSKLLVSQFVQGYESRTVTLCTLNVHTSKWCFIFVAFDFTGELHTTRKPGQLGL